MQTKDKIEQILGENIHATVLTILDDSNKHKGHTGAIESGGGHFHVLIVSTDFEGLTLVARHKKIYALLMNTLKEQIHALGIKALTPQEYANIK